MSMAEFQTLYYIMYKECLERQKKEEQEAKAARDDEIKRQRDSGVKSKNKQVFTEEELAEMGIEVPKTSSPVLDPNDPQNGNINDPVKVKRKIKPENADVGLAFTDADLEQLLEEEGLI